MESQPQNPEFRNNPELFTHVVDNQEPYFYYYLAIYDHLQSPATPQDWISHAQFVEILLRDAHV